MNPGSWRNRFSWWILRVHWLLGVAALAIYTETSTISLLFVTAAWALGVWMDAGETPRERLSRLGPVFVIILLAAVAADLFLLRRDILSAVSLLLIGIQSIRMVLPKNIRESWQLCAISLLEFLIAASVADELSFAFFSFTFLIVSICSLWSLHDLDARKSGRPAGAYAPSFKTAAVFFLLLSIGSFLLTAIFFAAVPRMEFRRLFLSYASKKAITGFSDRITLSEITNFKQDHRVVARVEFPLLDKEPAQDTLYLRGGVYSRYSEGAWRSYDLPVFAVSRTGAFYLFPAAAHPDNIQVADITLESATSPRLLIYGTPIRIETNAGPLVSDREGNVFLTRDEHPTFQYRLVFTLEPYYQRKRDVDRGALYLEFPRHYEDIRRLAIEITKNANTDEERIALLLDFFRHGFSYSLDNPASTLHSFLFEKKTGFCEHFASGLALMLRAVGIHSRVAVGYLGGEWNVIGRYLIVRQSHAHAWVEAWVDGHWMTLDATPPQPEESYLQRTLGVLGMYADWLRHRWDNYVINYSIRMQTNAVKMGLSGLRQVSRQASFGGALKPVPVAAAGIVVLMLWTIWRMRGRTIRKTDRLPAHYDRLLRRLEKSGYRNSPGLPMQEMVENAVKTRPDLAEEAKVFLSLYHLDRFGPGTITTTQREEAALRADQLRKKISP